MVKTGSSLRTEVAEGYDRKRRKQRQLHALNILFLIILLSLFMLGFNRVISYEKDITRTTFTITGALAVPVLEMEPAHKGSTLVAVVAHGFAGSKDLMTGFGEELARAGITTYLLDFPGHGQSSVPFQGGKQGEQENVAAVGEVVNYARIHTKTVPNPGIILLGHSMGSTAVGEYAMEHKYDADILATILVSPVWQGHPDLTGPKNLLLLVGQNDLASSLALSRSLLASGCEWTSEHTLPSECGALQEGTGRRAVVLAGLNHITILNANSTFDETLSWLHRLVPDVKTTNMDADVRLSWLLLAVGSLLLAILPLCALLANIFTLQPAVRMFSGMQVLLFHMCLVVGMAAAIGLQYTWWPFHFLHIMLVDYVTGYFFITALITSLLFFILRRTLPLPAFSQVGRQVLLGLVLAVFLYLTFAQLTTFAWEHVTFTLARLWRFVVIFVLILPMFLLDEGINRGYQERSRLRGIFTGVATKVLLLGGLVGAIFFTPGLGFLSIVLPLLLIVFLMLAGFCTQLYVSGRAGLAGALLSALTIAWCLSTTLPIT